MWMGNLSPSVVTLLVPNKPANNSMTIRGPLIGEIIGGQGYGTGYPGYLYFNGSQWMNGPRQAHSAVSRASTWIGLCLLFITYAIFHLENNKWNVSAKWPNVWSLGWNWAMLPFMFFSGVGSGGFSKSSCQHLQLNSMWPLCEYYWPSL